MSKVAKLLNECGAVLERDGKHEVWLLPNGKKFTRAKTPSDYRAEENQLHDLRHALGLVDSSPKLEEGQRREKKPRVKRPPQRLVGSPMASAMVTSGAVSLDDLQSRIEMQRTEITKLIRANEKSRTEAQRLIASRCRWCKLKDWWSREW